MPADELADKIVRGLHELMEKDELCDVSIVVGVKTFPAHRCVLAIASPVFQEKLKEAASSSTRLGQHWTIPVDAGSSSEAVRIMLDSIYGKFGQTSCGADGAPVDQYSPSSDGINRDVLKLAQQFQLPQLEAHAARWLARNITTSNVVERLATCEEFKLPGIRSKIMEHLVAAPAALLQVAKSSQVAETPLVLQDLLVQVLTLLGCGSEETIAEDSKAPPAKKAKKVPGITL